MKAEANEVFLPWRGEFGQMLMHYVRWVRQQIQDNTSGIKQVVCCRRGDEALFPDADDYFYGWEQVPDEKRNTRLLKSKANVDYLDRLKLKIVDELGSCGFIEPPKKTDLDPRWNFKPQPRTIMDCPDIDVLVCPRFRKHGQHRNYRHWETVVKGLQAHGLTVALAGMKQTSVDVRSVPEHLKSWNYDSLDSTLHMMNSSRLVLATDAGLAHLAVLNHSPMMVIYDKPGVEAGKPQWPWALPHMQKYAVAPCDPLIDGWNNPELVVKSVAARLGVTGNVLATCVAKLGLGRPTERPKVLVCSMVYRYQKRYWWQLSSLLQQRSWEGHVVPKIEAHADISARDENYGWNDELLRLFNGLDLGIRHTQRKWPKVDPPENDPYGCRGHLRSKNIRDAIKGGFDWILFNDADMVYDSQFFSHMMTLVDASETRVYATDRWTMLFEDGYKIVDSVKYRGPIEDPTAKIEAGVTQQMWKSARGRISGAGFFQLVSVAGLKKKIAEDQGFIDYVPPQYNRDHNTCDEDQTHITRSDKKFRDRLGGIVAIRCQPQYHLNHYRRDHEKYDPEVLH